MLTPYDHDRLRAAGDALASRLRAITPGAGIAVALVTA